MRLGRQAAPGTTERVVVRFVPTIAALLVIGGAPVYDERLVSGRRMFVPCWCARAIVESALTPQSILPSASASVRISARTASQVPSELYL
jgi:hypothetical protein